VGNPRETGASQFIMSPRAARKAEATKSGAGAPAAAPEILPRDRWSGVENTVISIGNPDDLVDEISKLWSEAQAKFIAIGRYLVRAKQLFEGSFDDAIVSRLPFGRIVAYQLRMVAEAVDTNKLPEDCLPRSYATAYKLISLAPTDYEEARRRGLLRPDITRPEVEAFKASLKAERVGRLSERDALAAERVAIMAEMARAQERLLQAKSRLAEIAEVIGPPDHEGPVIDGSAPNV